MTKEIYESRKNKLIQFYQKHKYLPTYDEIVDLFKLKSKGSVHKYIQRFIEEGILRKTESGKLIPTNELFGLKKLGTVQAGFPSTAEEELADTVSLDDYLIEHPNASYLLSISGDSMIEAGIVEGDMVIVDRSKNPKSGDIVVAEVDGEWTIKYFMQRNSRTFLKPGNRNYPNIYPQNEMKIGGVVTSVIRKY